ncbi:MFS transporter [Glutamicibacter protophormiae]|uniref:MFS transporter n=1 Tax=Glutamicibacter protophormiae TaxID=37930 RepID=UPI002A830A15|nr:MFS transporter [Glutamicibacter protophormiae]WPR66014.1 MFS transporter [Glutamicibacter protophormiae]WPR69512.1 MFS transporter [Glutamicibacter protophormiae]
MKSGYSALVPMVGLPYLPLTFLARLPLAMLTIGSMTLVTANTGSYGLGGLAAAMVGLGSAVGGPSIGYLADRRGQRPVLLAAAVLHTILLIAFTLFANSGAELAVGPLVALCLLAGATGPQVGPMSRVRWIAMSRGTNQKPKTLTAALSLESMLDELGFVFGPVAVGLLASLVSPVLPLYLAAALTIVLVPLFALHRTAGALQPGASVHSAATVKISAGQVAAIGSLVLSMIALGTVFGSTAAGTLAFAGAQGDSNQGGLLYGAMGVSSAIAAISVAAWPQGFSQISRWIACGAALSVLSFGLHLADSTPWMLAALFVAGFAVGPVIVTVMTLGGEVAPPQRLSTVMTMLSAGIVVGTAIGNGLAGLLADSMGYLGAFWVATGGAFVILLAGLIMKVLASRAASLRRVR